MRTSSIFLFLFLLSCTLLRSLADDTTSFVYAGCSQLKYVAGTPYQYNINSLFASLANSAGFTPFANFTSSLASPAATVYGLYQCRGDLTIPDCESCVKSCITQLSSLCSSSCGGALQLQGCFVRFGNESFLGQQDKTVLYRKCGPGAGNYDGDLMGMRDSVLAALAASAGGPFRVGRAGYMEGMAQCVGDLGARECDDCLAEASNQLRSSCGLAVSGEVYLGKCYAKYYSHGGYGYGSHSDHDHSNSDESSKTLAIIIGLMAAVALIIVFLSFLRREAGGDKGGFPKSNSPVTCSSLCLLCRSALTSIHI
ncbi:hypothetical protein Taro_007880 [Colocasia esculenta]|uniref:Gnk2-homologous domain-containing protein n=1 Tax=Colocasia esculenta TaxID=4460 RepID=A0A843TVJ6_COLES|nr:hypothetical protein [Colocasia esculenta]